MKVRCDVPCYKDEGTFETDATITVESHPDYEPYNKLIKISIGPHDLKVNGGDLIAAINNAMNCGVTDRS